MHAGGARKRVKRLRAWPCPLAPVPLQCFWFPPLRLGPSVSPLVVASRLFVWSSGVNQGPPPPGPGCLWWRRVGGGGACGGLCDAWCSRPRQGGHGSLR